jgi:hypothetical protein
VTQFTLASRNTRYPLVVVALRQSRDETNNQGLAVSIVPILVNRGIARTSLEATFEARLFATAAGLLRRELPRIPSIDALGLSRSAEHIFIIGSKPDAAVARSADIDGSRRSRTP